MHIWGKILGFLFGFMLSKTIFGALLGLWLGHIFDRGRGFNFNGLSGGKEDEVSRQAAFFYATFSVMGNVAKAKGQVTSHEIAFASAYMNKLGLNEELRQQAQDAFREGKSSAFPLKDRLVKFKRLMGNRHDLLLMFLEIQIQVAFSDGDLDSAERSVLHTIAKFLGYSAGELDNLLEMIIAGANFQQQGSSGYRQQGRVPVSGQQLNNAYKVLGIEKSSAMPAIKKAYKKLMSQHHPDKLIAKGLPPEMMEIAKQKTQDIQAAYDMIVKDKK
ncbi:co-chaperone DjlA [Colwellia psychrerythraea]|uniref:Co-chaperone protein DjlA n=1 Tax=Colwellia psychrerythraea TaxID=28229 RepID=A0A099KQ19_COLPS|nr:co-chaperone DjlA [Colwellia psychrerythraea]KGJ92320.1 Tellurite resistance TerB [Colwellia psychrerythraea]